MNKPITIKYKEFKDDLETVIYDSDLPPFIVESVLREYLMEVHNYAEQQYLKDSSMYREYVEKREKVVDSGIEEGL